jgi:outer membrane receptor for Fe3+-dicitrate
VSIHQCQDYVRLARTKLVVIQLRALHIRRRCSRKLGRLLGRGCRSLLRALTATLWQHEAIRTFHNDGRGKCQYTDWVKMHRPKGPLMSTLDTRIQGRKGQCCPAKEQVWAFKMKITLDISVYTGTEHLKSGVRFTAADNNKANAQEVLGCANIPKLPHNSNYIRISCKAAVTLYRY